MHKIYILSFLLLFPFLLSSCETASSSGNLVSQLALPASFTEENIMKVHLGMSSDDVLNLFGNPQQVRSIVTHDLETGDPIFSTRWEYGQISYGQATFRFLKIDDSNVLVDFDIDTRRSRSALLIDRYLDEE